MQNITSLLSMEILEWIKYRYKLLFWPIVSRFIDHEIAGNYEVWTHESYIFSFGNTVISNYSIRQSILLKVFISARLLLLTNRTSNLSTSTRSQIVYFSKYIFGWDQLTYPENVWSSFEKRYFNNIIWRQCLVCSTKRRIHQRKLSKIYFIKVLLFIHDLQKKDVADVQHSYSPRHYQLQPLRNRDIRLKCVIFGLLSDVLIRGSIIRVALFFP